MTEKTDSHNQSSFVTPAINVAPAPHVTSASLTTRKMMRDVLIALTPVLLVALYVFRGYLLFQLSICIAGCVAAEIVFTGMRGRRAQVGDLSAVVTGVILALSLPGTAPWFVGVIGSFAAIGLGKIVFGGLGQNIFNPAMVGRAFVMIAFPKLVAAGGYVLANSTVDAVTRATPLTLAKEGGQVTALWDLFIGTTNGSLGETSAIACLIGGLYLCLRRTASWQIPIGIIVAVALLAGINDIFGPVGPWNTAHHLMGGALLFGALFIATDPVSSPLTGKGKWIFGIGLGSLVMIMRLGSRLPEGVMFSVLLMNAVVPLINRWTIPRPVGGPGPQKA